MRYVLLLRGVNVGTKNALPMAELRAMLAAAGCTDVQTYVQSGNAVFATKLSAAGLAAAVEPALAAYMGRPIATTLRTEPQLAAIVGANPFRAIAHDPARLCVTFLGAALADRSIGDRDWGAERVHIAGTEIYTWHPDGQGKSPLAGALAKLPVQGAATTRNWNTVLKLRELVR